MLLAHVQSSRFTINCMYTVFILTTMLCPRSLLVANMSILAKRADINDIAGQQISEQARRALPKKNDEVVAGVTCESSSMEEEEKTMLAEELSKITMVESQEIRLPVNLKEQEPTEKSMNYTRREFGLADKIHWVQASRKPAGLRSFRKKGWFSVTSVSEGCNHMSTSCLMDQLVT